MVCGILRSSCRQVCADILYFKRRVLNEPMGCHSRSRRHNAQDSPGQAPHSRVDVHQHRHAVHALRQRDKQLRLPHNRSEPRRGHPRPLLPRPVPRRHRPRARRGRPPRHHPRPAVLNPHLCSRREGPALRGAGQRLARRRGRAAGARPVLQQPRPGPPGRAATGRPRLLPGGGRLRRAAAWARGGAPAPAAAVGVGGGGDARRPSALGAGLRQVVRRRQREPVRYGRRAAVGRDVGHQRDQEPGPVDPAGLPLHLAARVLLHDDEEVPAVPRDQPHVRDHPLPPQHTGPGAPRPAGPPPRLWPHSQSG